MMYLDFLIDEQRRRLSNWLRVHGRKEICDSFVGQFRDFLKDFEKVSDDYSTTKYMNEIHIHKYSIELLMIHRRLLAEGPYYIGFHSTVCHNVAMQRFDEYQVAKRHRMVLDDNKGE